MRRLRALRVSGKLKRIGAVLRHQNSGYAANAMVVFKAPPDEMERLGKLLAESPLVSHCYERASCAEWPYTLYAMMHGRNMETIEEFVRGFASEQYVERLEVYGDVDNQFPGRKSASLPLSFVRDVFSLTCSWR